MKNLFINFIIFLSVILTANICFADIMPLYVKDIPDNTMGVYQTDKIITVFAKPDEKSAVVCKKEINYPNYKNIRSDKFFAVIIPDKELGFAYVTDVADDESWVQIIYDRDRNLKGWIKRGDDFQFMPWGTFFDMYGRKYGLYRLKKSEDGFDGIYSQPDRNSQVLGNMQNPKYIRMIAVEGSWALISELDFTNYTKTGYVEWTTEQGQILLFPDIK